MALRNGGVLGGSGAVFGAVLKEELSSAELEAARLGFTQMLRRKRFSARFIETNADDLLGRARFEYTRAVRRGEQIRSPAGWLIHCAWRRTQNLLEAESHEPQFVSTEKAQEVVDRATPSPEEAAISEDRARAIEAAMSTLTHDQRTLIELTYFEGMSVREAGRFLGWHSSKAQRTHESALRALREALGISDVDQLAIELGLAAWVSLAGAKAVIPSIPAGVEAMAESGARGAQGLWAKTHELGRRLLLGGAGEPSGAMAAGNVARAAGVCGAAAVACLAGGVVGPGVGGVGLIDSQHHAAPAAKERAPAANSPKPITEAPAPAQGAEATAAPKGQSGKVATAGKTGNDDTTDSTGEATPKTQSAPAQAESEFGAFGESTADTHAPAPPTPAPPAPSSAPTGGGSAVSSAGSQDAGQEFGAFR